MAMASARSSLEIVPHSGDFEEPPADVPRQDSLYRDAIRPAHGGHHGQVCMHGNAIGELAIALLS
jgi:KUP system potassium uptake protein